MRPGISCKRVCLCVGIFLMHGFPLGFRFFLISVFGEEVDDMHGNVFWGRMFALLASVLSAPTGTKLSPLDVFGMSTVDPKEGGAQV